MNGVPDGYNTVNTYLLVEDVPAQIDFLVNGLGGTEVERHLAEDGTIANAEVRVGDSMVMMGTTRPEWGAARAMLYVFVADCDATYQQAMAAGATSVQAPADMFYGDRNGAVIDPGGNQWWIAQRLAAKT